MQFEILKFRQKIWIYAHLSINFSVKIPGVVAFFDLILRKLHVRPSLNQFWCFLRKFIDKKFLVFSLF